MKAKEEWLVFFYRGKELLRYTLRGTFPGEREATIEQLAYEYGCDGSEIYYAIVRR